jgi:hypothetical protein
MPPKKQKKPPAANNAPEAFTPERFERELKDLAAKAKDETFSKYASEQVAVYAKTAVLLTLVAFYANVSLLSLSPVYGSIPSSRWHPKLVMTACFVGWSANLFLARRLPVKPVLLLPLIALYIPPVQFYLSMLSGQLSAHWGPIVTEALTLFPLMVVSVSCVATYLEDVDLSRLPKWAADAAPGIGSWGFYKFMENLSESYLQSFIGQTAFQTRLGLQIILGAAYAVFAPSKWILLCTFPALLHTGFLNYHAPTPTALRTMNAKLLAEQWSLLDRKESITGYVSVLDNMKDGYRVMRCDHSLLGGEWTKFKGSMVAEPIYGVFLMLEAVRLVEVPSPVPDAEASALVM